VGVPFSNPPATKKETVMSRYKGNRGIVQIWFKEVLQQLPEELATEWVNEFNEGEDVALFIHQNPRGKNYVTAFSFEKKQNVHESDPNMN
jgi:hypothetical protein